MSVAAGLLAAIAAACTPPPPGRLADIQTADTPSPSPVEAASTPELPTLSPTTSPSIAPTPAVLIAAGDIAGCGSQGDESTALLIETRPGTVAALGDTAYERGAPRDFTDCYEPSWGRFKDRTRPAVGNHEYLTAGASGYFEYFGAAAGDSEAGYYSYDLGAWHVVVINSQCWEVGGCGREDPQAVWMRADLAASSAVCTLAYWHVPRFSSGWHGSSDLVDVYWDLLYEAGAEIALSGHDHDYERFAPQNDDGVVDRERGIREFVVGTGGHSRYPFPGEPIANSETRNASTFGVLVLTLHVDRYDWEFVPTNGGAFTDRGSEACHP